MTAGVRPPVVALDLRPATTRDVGILAGHRVGMFRDMGAIRPEREAALREISVAYLAMALESGEYLGWLAGPQGAEPDVVGGVGVHLRPMLPRPGSGGAGILVGREALVVNVYVEPAWRRKGVARRVMEEVLRWARSNGVGRLVLHASADGRPLYESLGFVASNEMRFAGPLTTPVG